MRKWRFDKFDTFDATVLVKDVKVPMIPGVKRARLIFRAGLHFVETDYQDVNSGRYRSEQCVLCVKQGTTKVQVELVDQRKRALGSLVIDPEQILGDVEQGTSGGIRQKWFDMRRLGAATTCPSAPRVQLSIVPAVARDEYTRLLGGVDTEGVSEQLVEQLMSKHAAIVAQGQSGANVLATGHQDLTRLGRLLVLASACEHSVRTSGKFGFESAPMHLTICMGPGTVMESDKIRKPRWYLCVWKSQEEARNANGNTSTSTSKPSTSLPKIKIPVSKIALGGVKQCPSHETQLLVPYLDDERQAKSMELYCDRRDVLVEAINLFLATLRAEKKRARANAATSAGSESDRPRG